MKAKRQDNPALKALRALSSAELKVYVALLILSGPERHIVRQSLSDLANLSGLSGSTISKSVGELCRKGHISYKSGDNQHRLSEFRIGKTVAGLGFGMAREKKSGTGNPLREAKIWHCCAEKKGGASITNKDLYNFDIEAFKGEYKPKTKEEILAREIAHAFNDMEGIGLYLDYCRRYPESIIRRAYGEVKELPDSAIRRSRGALFNYLVQKYANEQE